MQREAVRGLRAWPAQLKEEAKLGKLREAARVQPELRAVLVVQQVAPGAPAELQQGRVVVAQVALPAA